MAPAESWPGHRKFPSAQLDCVTHLMASVVAGGSVGATSAGDPSRTFVPGPTRSVPGSGAAVYPGTTGSAASRPYRTSNVAFDPSQSGHRSGDASDGHEHLKIVASRAHEREMPEAWT